MNTSDLLLDRAIRSVSHLGDPQPPWAEILESGRRLIGADSAAFMTFDGKGALTLQQDHIDPSAERDYIEHFHVLDVGLKTAMTCPSGSWIDTHDLMPARVMEKSPYYADFMCKHRMRQIVCYIVQVDLVHRACFSFQRDRIDVNARQHLEGPQISGFAHAMEAGLAARRQLAVDRLKTMEDSLWLHEAVCLVSSNGMLCHASQRARDMLEGSSHVRIRGGRIWHPRIRVQEAICAALRKASVSQHVMTLSIPDGPNGTLVMDLKRADAWMRLGNEALVIVRLKHSGVSEDVSLNVMHAVFDLSPAEGRVLDYLVAGLSATEIAAAAGTSLHTARKHIVLLMEKTGTKRQSDLVRIALQR